MLGLFLRPGRQIADMRPNSVAFNEKVCTLEKFKAA